MRTAKAAGWRRSTYFVTYRIRRGMLMKIQNLASKKASHRCNPPLRVRAICCTEPCRRVTSLLCLPRSCWPHVAVAAVVAAALPAEEVRLPVPLK